MWLQETAFNLFIIMCNGALFYWCLQSVSRKSSVFLTVLKTHHKKNAQLYRKCTQTSLKSCQIIYSFIIHDLVKVCIQVYMCMEQQVDFLKYTDYLQSIGWPLWWSTPQKAWNPMCKCICSFCILTMLIMPESLEAVLIQNAHLTIYCNVQPESIELNAYAVDATFSSGHPSCYSWKVSHDNSRIRASELKETLLKRNKLDILLNMHAQNCAPFQCAQLLMRIA